MFGIGLVHSISSSSFVGGSSHGFRDQDGGVPDWNDGLVEE